MSKSHKRPTDANWQRIWIELNNTDAWYAVMRDLGAAFGTNWRGQARVRRRLQNTEWFHRISMGSPTTIVGMQAMGKFPTNETAIVWFDVPDPGIATWIAVKQGLKTYLARPKKR